MIQDAIAELVARSKPHKELTNFHEFHRQHPEVFDFLIREIQSLVAHGRRAFSFHSLWQYARWKLLLMRDNSSSYKMNDHLGPWYARAIMILHPEFAGWAELRKSAADESFGVELEQKRTPGRYARRLQWVDGTPLDTGWRPSEPHVAHIVALGRPDVHARAQ